MNATAIDKAAQIFAEARKSASRVAPLPADLLPADFETAHAVQDATVARLGAAVAGWKVGLDKDGVMTRAPILAALTHESPARVAASSAPLLKIESEIAFRFTRALPPRASDYTRAEVMEAADAFAAIEILNSRYSDPGPRTQLERLADCFNNGGIVTTPSLPGWRSVDFSALQVVLTIDGKEIARKTGTHPTGDPIGPAVALVNHLRKAGGVAAGQFITTGTWTGITDVAATSDIVAAFDGFTPARLTFTA